MATRDFATEKDPEGVLKGLADHLVQQFPDISIARRLKGGWEPWLQVVAALYLRRRVGMHYDFVREQNDVFPKQSAIIDLWMTPIVGQEAQRSRIGIELKTESAYQVRKGLKERFIEDVEKCVYGPKNEFLTNAGTTFYCVGLTSAINDLKGWKTFRQTYPQEEIYYSELVEENVNTSELPLYMLWWTSHFS